MIRESVAFGVSAAIHVGLLWLMPSSQPATAEEFLRTRSVSVDVKLQPPPDPPVEKVQQPKEETHAQAQETQIPAPTPRPVTKRTSPRKSSPATSQPPSLALSNVGDGEGAVAIQKAEEDSFGDPVAPPSPPAQPPPPSESVIPPPPPPAPKRDPVFVRPAPKNRCQVTWPEGVDQGQGAVSVKLLISVGPDGKVASVKVLKSGGELFDAEAVKGTLACAFEPATRDGVPISDRVAFTVEFVPYGQ